MIVYLIELAENRATRAKEKANKVALVAAAKVSDLEQEETPESIMLSTMTVEGAKDRTDREVVVPWLKFLWETYRAVLELLHKNVKLEKVYHKTCEKAFKFCLEYNRVLEFRRLCDILRLQLSNLQRQGSQLLGGSFTSRIQWDWTPESIETQLQIRFAQLEAATVLEQWNESFRTVEDIYSIMQQGKKAPKPRLMAVYYDKLTRIFWVSGNYLFHAYACFRYYNLYLECKKDIKSEDKRALASCVLLSALCIPSSSSSDVFAESIEDGVDNEKNQQMAMLLDFQTNPTRSALLNDIVNKGLLDEVYPELSQLYHITEVKFQPLTLVKSFLPMLQLIKDNVHLCIYSVPLQKIMILQVMKQLSKVYTVMKQANVLSLFKELDFSEVEIEKVLLDGIVRKHIHLNIDHVQGCYRFGQAVTIAPLVETQLYTVASGLNNVNNVIQKSAQVDNSIASINRTVFLSMIKENSLNNFGIIQERKMMIERRKEGLERLQQERIRQEDEAKKREEGDRVLLEQERLKEEEDRRLQEKLVKLQERRAITKFVVAMEALGKYPDAVVLSTLDEKGRREMLLQAQIDAQHAKEEEAKRLSDQAKNLDYISRALRLEAADKIRRLREIELESDRKENEKRLREINEKGKEEHVRLLVDKVRLSKTVNFISSFEASVIESQRVVFQQKVDDLKKKAFDEHMRKNVSRARRLKRDEDERLEEEAEIEREAREQAEEIEQLRRTRAEEEQRQRDHELEEARKVEQARAEQQKQRDVREASSSYGRPPPAEEESGWRRQGPSGKQRGPEVSEEETSSWSRRGAAPAREEESGSATWSSRRGPSSSSGNAAAPTESAWRGGGDRNRSEDNR